MLTVVDLCERFNVELREHVDGYGLHPLGNPPTIDAAMSASDGNPRIEHRFSCENSEIVLHELCHFLVGPKSLEDEGPLMVLQWGFMQHLTPGLFEEHFESFKEYHFGFIETGEARRLLGRDAFDPSIGCFEGTTFTQASTWKQWAWRGYRAGLLTKKGKPYWRKLRVDPLWL